MKQFFITFFANLAALLFVFGGPVLLLFILILASFSNSNRPKHLVSIERNSILVMDLSMNVTDSPEHATDNNPFSSAFNQDNTRSVTLRSLVKALKKAAKDDRITALFIQGSFEPADFGTGYACLKELREAILDFEKGDGKTPKKVYAYLESPTTRDYYVASAASYIYMNPYGEMETPGLAVVKTYYAGALQKYGIGVQVTRVGKYKSAVEPFILNKMSDADREETQKLIDNLWGDFVSAVSESRHVDPNTFQQLVNTEGYILPDSARDAHLIDKEAYFGDVLNDLGKIAPSSDYARIPLPFKQVAIGDYINSSRTPRLIGDRGSDNVVAILYLEGEIVDGDGDLTNIGGDRFAAELRQLRKDSEVKAVVLRVNSPGGSAYASEVIQREIIALKAKKPVIISMGNYAASGGYWISTYGNRIFAEPNTLTGSIGVFGMFTDIQKIGNGFGITWDTAKTSNFADFETISRPKTDQELALAQGRVDDLYDKFLTKVSDSRGIPKDALELIAQGRVWTGDDALHLKLVDEIGGLEKAVSYAAEQTKLGERYRVKEYPEKATFADALALLFNNQEEPVSHIKLDPLTQQFLKIKSDLKSLQEFNDPIGVYARMPLGWEIK
ncbi:MAG: signal peptide peptidase SppA [Methylacidiphilales bacterium]|nr:signal peptide peptidase SppA [Candidatus Methylacidiphilales bacterium]